MNVNDIMTRSVISVGQDEPVTAAARLLERYNIGSLPVINSAGDLRGIVTDRDIALRCAAIERDYKQVKIGDIMSRAVVTGSPGDSVETAARRMSSEQVRRLPITSGGKVVGMLSLCDMARNGACDMEASAALTKISANIRKK